MISPHAAISGATPPMEFLFYASIHTFDRCIFSNRCKLFRIRRFVVKMCVQPMLRKVRGRFVLRSFYFHSQNFETVLPELSTSYSNAPHALFIRASFCDAVLKNSIPR